MTILEMALSWLSLGIAVIPIAFRSKLPDSNALKWTGHVDNGRASWTHFQSNLPTERELETWTRGPRINLAVVTGWQNLVVLDFDSLGVWTMYEAWLEDNSLARLVAETTYKVSTGRGMHLYLSIDEPVRNSHVGAIDIKAGGGYVLTPPSIHPTGRMYSAIDPCAPICRVDCLADVFPFEPEESSLSSTGITPPITERPDDPFESADRVAPGNLITRIRQSFRIEDQFRDLTPSGRGWFLTHCPLHDDSSPSFWIDTDRQLCGCYAGCTRRPMDVINLYARTQHMSNDEALKELARRL